MKEYVISFLILLFGISFNNGHTLSRIELNETDIYEVKEGQSTLTITHPKDGKPTLREIVYFHVIEKPYDNDDQVDETPDINKRSFTNGHGFQYFEEHDDVIDDTGTDEDESVTEKDEYYDGDDNETGDTTTEGTDTTDDNDSENDDDEEHDNDDTEDPINTDDVDLKNGANDKEIGTINDDENPKDIDDIKKPENIDSRFGDVDNSPTNNEPSGIEDLPESRRKREIDYKNLPAAPELPEFKLDILPDYIKAIIFADQDADENTNGSDNIEDEIEKQVRLLERAANHPPSVERENDNEKRDARTFGNSLEERKSENTEGTYGMSLTGNVGKVWNNVDGHQLHYINDPVTPTSTISKLEAKDTTTEAFVNDHTETFYRDDHGINKLKDLDALKNFGDSLDEINNLLEELVKNSTLEEKTIVTTDTSDNNKEDSFDIDHPLTVEDNYSKERESVYENEPADDKKDQKREARTYGMSLAGDRGVVWNDVNTHLAYHVGEPDTISTTLIPDVTDSTVASTTAPIETSTDNGDSKEPQEVTDEEQLKDIGDSLDEINKLLEELLNMTTEAKTPSTDKSTNVSLGGDDNGGSKNIENDKDSDHLKDIEDSFDEVNKLFEELIKNSTNVNDSTTIATTEATITESDSTVATSTETTTTKVTTANSTDLDETTDISTEIPNNKIDGKNNDRKHNNGTHESDDSKQKQFVKELMKNKFFWQWLQDSSTAYLEVSMKKLDDIIKAEVDKQLKQYFEEHKNETNCNQDNKESQTNSTEKPIQNSNATDIDTIATTERPTANNTLEKPVETNTTDVSETSTENPVVTTEPSAVNNTIDKTDNNSNKTEDDLARKQNKDSNDKKEPVKIEANNVYGNSVGNGKVTNIFIFNISKESDLAKMKPLNNGTNGVFVFGLDDKTGKEKDEKTNEGNKPDTTKDVTDKPEINKVTTAKPEVVTDPATEEPKDKIDASTSENAVTDKQTTTTESSKITTTSTQVDNESATTEKVVESTTKKLIDSTTEKIIDSTTEEIKETTTQENKESTSEAVKESTEKSKDIETITQPEQDKANDKPTDGSTSSPNDEGDEKTEEPKKEIDNATSTTEKSNEDIVEDTTNVTKEDQTGKAETKEESTTETTRSSEVTTDKTATDKEKDKSEENEVDHSA